MKTSRDVPASPPRSTAKLRVVHLVRLHEGAEARFLEAYEQVGRQITTVQGHLSGQLCQSTEDPLQWIITSEWQAPEHYFAWLEGDGHRELVAPMHACVQESRSFRFTVRRETAS
ncbi:hypothetical protein TH66_22520 [Carbonactinospora thermoautotrophica]|uniref:ABM domain-containing protein n=1 Tax=Carbonactinospora thermoautotrophica TaxID=1469144 RepID=A0A132MJZ8_9ACTN|nr:antibiotic biosynthesis monooxygenase family protein [Carbonactinospora thermoautotrophica]KWW98069.1 hypothetical protein TH66_22520 [Carbonactinospora thermoautotrophica]KWX09421.1 hypothetical protein TR74_09680 [Carbonactinospora thermoautotrophica]